jgi:hypothetical protein
LNDEALAERLSARPLAAREVCALVDDWIGALGPLGNIGELSQERRASAARVVTLLRAQLRAAVAAGQLETLELAPSVIAIYMWEKIFANPLSVAAIDAAVAPQPAPAGGGDPVLRALAEPLPPRVPDAGAIVAAQPSVVGKIIAAIWLLGVPPTGVTPEDSERFSAHAQSICAVLPPLSLPVASPIAHALTINAFRAAYGGGNLAPALGAIGKFIAATLQAHYPAFARRPPARPLAGRKIKLGYVSSNFRRHAVTSYMANRVLLHDRDRFDVTLFAVGGKHDDVTDELAAAADRFVPLDPHPLDRVARAIVDAELDLVIHVDIGMNLATHLLAGLYLGPRQIALMGHAVTTGMPTITHYIGGDHEPPYAQAHYIEQLVRLPWCGAAQRPPPPPRRTWTRAELGVPDDAIVLANFGHALKHGPARDALYAEILARVPRAHLLVKPFFSAMDYDPALVARLAALGRVTLVPHVPRPEDLPGLYSLVDIQLDTYPFGGWTTNLDSLAAGVPIVTQTGDSSRSRWGSRFLEVCGVEIGRAITQRDYIEAAVRLAQDDALRRQVGSQIRGSSARFFDGPAAQSIYERALLDMIQEAGRDGGPVT